VDPGGPGAALDQLGASVRRRGASPDERGTTLVEVLVATTLAVVVIGVLLGTFDSVTRATAAHERTLDARADLRQAAAEATRDIRAASAVLVPTDPADWRRELTLVTTGADGSQVTVRLVALAAPGTFVREVLDGGGAPRSRALLRNARFGSDPRVFRYFGPDGLELSPDSVEGDRIAACLTRVEITLTAGRERGGTQILTVGASPRSRLPEEATC